MTDAPGAAGNSLPITYLSGTSTSKVYFPETYGSLTAMSMCAVTRRAGRRAPPRPRGAQQPTRTAGGPTPQVHERPVAVPGAHISAVQGQPELALRPLERCASPLQALPRQLPSGQHEPRGARPRAGYSGVAYFNGWLPTTFATTATKWVSTCASWDTVTGQFTLSVDGALVGGALAGIAVPDQLTINGNTLVDAEWSDWGARFRALPRSLSILRLTAPTLRARASWNLAPFPARARAQASPSSSPGTARCSRLS